MERQCDCGCGRTFKRQGRGKSEKRFYSEACRSRYHGQKLRYIRNVRPRSDRAHHGAEFQLTVDEIAFIASVRDSQGCANGTEALRHIIKFYEDFHV